MNLEIVATFCANVLADLGFAGLPWYVLPSVVVGLLLVLLVWAIVISARNRLNAALPPSHRHAAGRKALGRARAAEKAGQKSEAAKAYTEAGLVDKAVVLYVQDGKVSKAAEALVAVGRIADAAGQYRHAAKWEQAGRLYKQAGDLRRAAECFDSGINPREAAEAWEVVEEFETAGDRYLTIGDFARATRAFERSGTADKFVAAFVPWWEEEMETHLGTLEPLAYWAPAIAKATDDAERLGIWDAALKLSGYQGRWRTAALAAESLNLAAEAKRFYRLGQDLDGVARMAEKSGAVGEAYIARGEAAEKAAKFEQAAEFFEKAGEAERALELWQRAQRWPEAARLAENLGRLEDAASAYAKAGAHSKVAELYFKLGHWDASGAAFEAAGELQLAADAYRKGQNFLAAARLAETTGKTQAAIQDLQQHLRKVGQDRETSLKLVELMMLVGMRGTALGILEPMVTARPLNDVDADILYKFGMLLEDEGRYAEAGKAYERLLAYDVAYRDARARVERLKNLSDRSDLSGSGGGTGYTPPAATPARAQTPQHTPPPQAFQSPMATGGGLPAGFDSTPTPLPGGGATQQILDRYEPKGELGRGGMGIVIKAHDKLLDRMVAIKLVKTPGVNTGQLDKILSEARATAKLNHPNIVQIYDCAIAQGNFMMAMEYVQGQTVKDLIDKDGALPLAAAILIFGQVAKALQFAHEHGLVHRDIKPANILWTEDKRVKITDFGLARAAQELANSQTVVVGSPYYMAPEQLMGKLMDHRVDIYALGVSMFEVVTGQLPFPKGDVGYHHVHTQAPDPCTLRPELPTGFSELILAMLSKSPDARPKDCNQILSRLKQILQK